MFYYLFIVKGKNILVMYIIKKVNLFVKWWGYLRKYMDLKNIFNFGFE